MRARVYGIADPGEAADPAYVEGLRVAVTVALEYGLAVPEASEENPPAVPVALLAQARLAARNRIGLDTVLRRYLAGYTLLGDFLVHEAAEAGLPSAVLKDVLQAQAERFDRLLAAVSEEHAREVPAPASSEHRRLRIVQSLLAGKPVDPAELRYPFDGFHVGLVAVGPRAQGTVRQFAATLDRVLLAVCPEPHTVWAWLGGADPSNPLSSPDASTAPGSPRTVLAIGEPAKGLTGWRFTHRQAVGALPVASRGEQPHVKYVDVALFAAALTDELLATTLRRSYLEPLERGPDRGKVARGTLRAYFATGRNVSSSASLLGVNRNTVRSRLRAIEEAIGRSVPSCAMELEIALRLGDADA